MFKDKQNNEYLKHYTYVSIAWIYTHKITVKVQQIIKKSENFVIEKNQSSFVCFSKFNNFVSFFKIKVLPKILFFAMNF